MPEKFYAKGLMHTKRHSSKLVSGRVADPGAFDLLNQIRIHVLKQLYLPYDFRRKIYNSEHCQKCFFFSLTSFPREEHKLFKAPF
jgi:hypothetical protein